MSHSSSTSLPSGAAFAGSQSRILAGVIALALGLALFVGTGFAAPSLIHNATHDSRHALGLPCH